MSHTGFAPDPSKNVKAFSWNKAGTGLAWSNMNTVTVAVRDAKTDKWVVRHQLPQPKVRFNHQCKHLSRDDILM